MANVHPFIRGIVDVSAGTSSYEMPGLAVSTRQRGDSSPNADRTNDNNAVQTTPPETVSVRS